MRRAGNAYWAVGALLLGIASAHLAPAPASAAGCATSPTVQGTLFSGAEAVSYSENEYATIGLGLNDYGIVLPMTLSWAPLNDECENAVTSGSSVQFDLPLGVSSLSIRFISPQHFELWDDTHASLLTAGDLPPLPAYARARFTLTFRLDARKNITTSDVLIREGEAPPLLEGTLATPSPCAPLEIGGSNRYYFDSYEHAEYVDGYLRVHLRLKSPYNDGRAFRSAALASGEDCALTLPSYASLPHTTQFPPYMRYYSFRMTSPTLWQLWDDESDMPLACASCAGEIPADATYVSWYGSIDGNASFLRTTPFPPLESRPKFPGEYDPVVVIPGILGSWEKSGEWVIDPVLHVYDDLIETFEANGYVRGETIFPFPYNWRDSNIDTANLLKQEIARIRGICGCGKVDVVAHSMGGLVARAYAQGDDYQSDIDQLVFLGTPHLGAPEVYLMWEGGEIEKRSNFDFLKELIFLREAEKNGYTNIFEYVRGRPVSTVNELLPVFNYLSDQGGLREYPDQYPANEFLENLADTVHRLISRGIHLKNIVGNFTDGAITAFDVTDSDDLAKWEHGKPETTLYAEGDRKVPRRSSSVGDTIGIDKEFAADHTSLNTAASGYIFDFLNNRQPTTIVDDTDLPNVGFILIQLFSPIDMVITAPDGKKLGKDFSTGAEINEIPGAFYSGFIGDNEYAVIPEPLDGKYIIETIGTGAGDYTIAASFINDDGSTTSEVVGIAEDGELAKAELLVDISAERIELESTPTDATPPTITITAPMSTRYTRLDEVKAEFTVSDESLISETAYLLNGAPFDVAAPLPFTSMSLGSSTLEVGAIDEFGNRASSTVEFLLGATPQSAIADLNRAYETDWILRKSLRDELVDEFKELQELLANRERMKEGNLHSKTKRALLLANMALMKKILDVEIPRLLKRHKKYLTPQGITLVGENVQWLRKELIQ